MVTDTINQMASLAHLLNTFAPQRRADFGGYLLSHEIDVSTWYVQPDFLRSLRTILFSITAQTTDQRAMRSMLDVAGDSRVVPHLEKAEILEVFLYVWNVYALWYQIDSRGESTFLSLLLPDIQEAITTRMASINADGGSRETLANWIQLTGLLTYAGLEKLLPANIAWRQQLSSLPSMIGPAYGFSFLPAVCYLLGLERLSQPGRTVRPKTWTGILAKSKDYSNLTEAMLQLIGYVRSRAQR